MLRWWGVGVQLMWQRTRGLTSYQGSISCGIHVMPLLIQFDNLLMLSPLTIHCYLLEPSAELVAALCTYITTMNE